MVLIFSSDLDNSTSDVMEWIHYLKPDCKVLRVNMEKFYRIKTSIHISNDSNKLQRVPANSNSKISSVWFRRTHNVFPDFVEIDGMTAAIESQKDELRYFKSGLFHYLKRFYHVNNPFVMKNDKIETLFLARDMGICIPDTLVTNSKKELLDFYLIHNKDIIIKSVYNLAGVMTGNASGYMPRTVHFKEEMLKGEGELLFPVTAQERIEKDFEIRVFFLEGKCYSMAIFSQENEKTKLDFRNYDRERPNRTVPYLLPKRLTSQLRKLMKALQLNSGSIDIMKAVDGKYVFLEVNPVGQFGMVSYPCNYNIEQEIAKTLIQHDKEI